MKLRFLKSLYTALFSAVLCLTSTQLSLKAETISVTNPNDSGTGTLRESFENSASGDIIDVLVSEVLLNSQIHFQHETSSTLTLSGTSYYETTGEKATISASSESWTSPLLGGLIQSKAANPAEVTLELIVHDLDFQNGLASYGGGAIYSFSGKLQVSDCSFSGNSTGANGSIGGAIALEKIVPNYTSTIKNSTFDNNQSANGGAIYLYNEAGDPNSYGLLNIENSVFQNNKAGQGTGTPYSNGGAINTSSGHMTIKDSLFIGNTADGSGGAIDSYKGLTDITGNSLFIGNESGLDRTSTSNGWAGGGAIASSGSTETNSDLTITANGNKDILFLANKTSGSMERDGMTTYARGGAIIVDASVTLTLSAQSSNIIFAGNTDALGSNAIAELSNPKMRSELNGKFYLLASENKSIIFHDAIEITSLTYLGKNMDDLSVAKGSIVFTGATYDASAQASLLPNADNTNLGGKGASAWLTSTFSSLLHVEHGSLLIEDKAHISVQGEFRAHAETTTSLNNGILSVSGGSFDKGSVLSFGWGSEGNAQGTLASESKLVATSNVSMSGDIYATLIAQDQIVTSQQEGRIAQYNVSDAPTSTLNQNNYKGGVDLSHYWQSEGGTFTLTADSTYYVTFDASFESLLSDWVNNSEVVAGDTYRIQLVDSSVVTSIENSSRVVFKDSLGNIWDASKLGEGWALESFWAGSANTGEASSYGYFDLVKTSPIPEPSSAALGLLGLGAFFLRRRR